MIARRATAAVRWLAACGRKARALWRWLVAERWLLFTIARWLAAVALCAWTVWQAILTGREKDDLVFAALHALYAFAGLLTAVMLVAHEMAGWVLTPVSRLIDAVLLPSDYQPPPADYTLARMYRVQMRYEESCDEYLKIIRYHPRELRAYLEGMNTAGEARQTELASKFFRLGQRAFRREETRRKLRRALETSCRTALLADETEAVESVDADEAAGDSHADPGEATPPATPAEPPDP